MKTINDLPIYDIWPIISKNLSIKDLFNCRLVNKQFKELSNATNHINRLIIGEPNLDFDDFCWFYNNTSIEDNEIISLKCFRTIRLLSIFKLDKYLKYLKIYDRKFKLEEISDLINLESIELGYNYYPGYYDKKIINSNNLKVYSFNLYYNLSVELNAPKLEKIVFNKLNAIQLNGNAKSIKHLVTTNYQNELEVFQNLEIMELGNIDASSLNENLLIAFKNLKKLNLNRINYLNDSITNSIIKILNDKIKLKRELDIYLEGFKIDNIDKLIELKAENQIWKYRLMNYDLLDLNLPFINQLDYHELNECVNNIRNDLPVSFFDKFFNLNKVTVNRKVDIDALNWFLNNLKCLTKLDLNCSSSFNQIFFNNLPNTIRCLYLAINYESAIDCNFIFKLSKLIEFTTHNTEDLFDLAFRSFEKLKYFKKFEFNYRNAYVKYFISIKKKEHNAFILNHKELEILDFDQLVQKCNSIRFRSK